MRINWINATEQIEQNTAAILDDLRVFATGELLSVSLQKGTDGFTLCKTGNRVALTYSRDVELYRAIGILLERQNENSFEAKGALRFENAGVMIDNCRNAVLNMETAKFFVRKLAVMGLNMLMLYMEDTYPIEGQPYFGYQRSRFSKAQLQELIAYGAGFGVRIVPAIQTLAHLAAALKWPAYNSVRETGDILMVGEEKTYELIDTMLASVRDCFGPGLVNLGMDEADMMGLVGYRKKNGCREQMDIFVEHLTRVKALCDKHELQPMIWSDMIWKCAIGGYYAGFELGEPTRTDMLDKLPKGVRLIYWDYDTIDMKRFDSVLQQHIDISSQTGFASGAWTWCGFAPSIARGLQNVYAGVKSSAAKGVPLTFVTAWGDDGNECSYMAVLPAMQVQAELAYEPDVTEEEIEKRFAACTGERFEDFLMLELPKCTPGTTLENRMGDTPEKYVFYQDLLTGLLDKHIGKDFSEFYREAAERLQACAARSGMPQVFDSLAKLCSVLAIKADMGLRLKAAYDSRDRATLAAIAQTEIPELLNRVEAFYEAFRKQWYMEKRPCGFEVQDLRIGALKSRLAASARRIQDFLDGTVTSIEELEEERLWFDGRTEASEHLNVGYYGCNTWKRMVTANNL